MKSHVDLLVIVASIVCVCASDSERAIDGTKGHPIKMEIKASSHLTGPTPTLLIAWLGKWGYPAVLTRTFRTMFCLSFDW